MSERKKIHPRWAVDGAGRIGRVTEMDEKSWQYFGETLGGGTWGSMAPQFLHPDMQEILERFYQASCDCPCHTKDPGLCMECCDGPEFA